MNRFNLEWAVAAWRRQYDTRRTFGRTDLDELERHLRDQTAWFVEHGMPEEEAFRKAVGELGSVFEAEDEYRKVFWKKLRFRGEASGELRWRMALLARHLVTGYRTLKRQKVVSFINIFGLSIALAASICVYIFLDSYMAMDRFHEQGDQIYMVGHSLDQEGYMQRWGSSPLPLASMLQEQVAGVERAVRVEWVGGRLFADDRFQDGSVLFVDDGYLDMMTFPIASGDPDPLSSPNSVAITPAAAERYFGTEDPLGQTISLNLDGLRQLNFTIRSILEPLPGASGTRFEILAPFEALVAVRQYDESDWTVRIDGTLILLTPGASPEPVETYLNSLLTLQNDADPEWQMTGFFLDNLRHPVERAYMINGRLMEAPHPLFIAILVLIPLAMMLLSVFNYVNIAIGSAERRLKEIGIRKLVGGVRSQLIWQFLVENVVLCSISLVLAGLISWAFILPVFDQIFVYDLTWQPVTEPVFWGSMLLLLLATAFASGAYPALYVSSFKPITILRGTSALTGRRLLAHVFLAVQFTISFVAILLGMYMAFGDDFLAEEDWGYASQTIATIPLTSPGQFSVLKSNLEAESGIRTVVGARGHVGYSQPGALISVDGREEFVRRVAVGAGYFEAIGLPIEEGRGFDPSYGADDDRAVVVTRYMMKQLGWDRAIGRLFRNGDTEYEVVGIASDPVINPMMRYGPLFFSRIPDSSATLAVIAGETDANAAFMDALEERWDTLFPDQPFDGQAQMRVFDTYVESWRNLTRSVMWLAGLSLIISCMGLFGLASQGVSARMKEISIRKVLGANAAWVALRVHTRYLILITIGAAIAMPLVYFGITTPLRMFDIDYITVGPGVFVMSYFLVIGMALVSILKHAWTLARANPAQTLRGE